MAPIFSTFSLNPLDTFVSGSLLLLRIFLFFLGYVALKLAFKTFISPRFSPFRSVRGPPAEKAWSGAMGEALDLPTGVAFHRWVKKYGGAVRFPTAFGSDALLLTDPAALHHIFVDKSYDYVKPMLNASAIGDLSGPGLIIAEGDSHKRQRKMMLPSFSPAHLRALAPVVVERSKELRQHWLDIVNKSVVEAGTFKTDAQIEHARQTLPKNEAVVEVQGWFNKLTLDIIGLAGFGHSFDTLSSQSSTLSSSWECFSSRVAQKPTPFTFLATRLVRTLAHIGKPIDLERFLPVERIQVDRKLRKSLEEESRKIIDEKIKQVEAEGKDSIEESKDLIALLLRANWGETKAPLSNEELRAEMMTILLAGHETTSNALSWLFLELARSPRIQAKLRDELVAFQESVGDGEDGEIDLNALEKLEYLDAVVHEIFRFEPSIGATTREALQSDLIPLSKPLPSATNPSQTISEVPIKKGGQIIVPIYAANRSTEIYGEDAEEFRPERWTERDEKGEKVVEGGSGLYNLTTFIQGPRSCIGYKFAIMELKIALAILLPTFTVALREPGHVVDRRAEVVTRSIFDGDRMGMVLRVGLADGQGKGE